MNESISHSQAYAAAGVDVTAGYEAVKRIKPMAQATAIPGVLGSLGGFGGMFAPDFSGMSEPVLVSGTDGVGTKLKLAFLLDRHDTIGTDCVAMCANDIVCGGAKPLFFLDYIAIGRNDPDKVADIVKGIADGCIQAGCALIGGETAEHPGLMPPDEYDVAGFCVGLVDRPKMLGPGRVLSGDIIIGIPSSGCHSNGFSLIRRALDISTETINIYYDELGRTLGEELLTPTVMYVQSLLSAIQAGGLHAAAHITGGGWYENIPRMMPPGLTARVDRSAIAPQPIYSIIARAGQVSERDMYNTFNMGLGMALAVAHDSADAVLTALAAAGQPGVVMGSVIAGDGNLAIG